MLSPLCRQGNLSHEHLKTAHRHTHHHPLPTAFLLHHHQSVLPLYKHRATLPQSRSTGTKTHHSPAFHGAQSFIRPDRRHSTMHFPKPKQNSLVTTSLRSPAPLVPISLRPRRSTTQPALTPLFTIRPNSPMRPLIPTAPSQWILSLAAHPRFRSPVSNNIACFPKRQRTPSTVPIGCPRTSHERAAFTLISPSPSSRPPYSWRFLPRHDLNHQSSSPTPPLSGHSVAVRRTYPYKNLFNSSSIQQGCYPSPQQPDLRFAQPTTPRTSAA